MSDIEELINSIHNQDFAQAQPMFTDILNQKMSDALDAERANVGSSMFEQDEDDEDFDDDDDDYELDDEDYEDDDEDDDE